MREFWTNMVNTTYISKDDMINKLQQIKGKTKLKLLKKLSNYYDNMKIRFDEDPFPRNAQGISKKYHEVLLLKNFLQTKPEVKNLKNNYYDLYNTVIRIRDEDLYIDNQYEDDNKFNDFITRNHYIGIKLRKTILR